jgi:hypothetical protein
MMDEKVIGVCMCLLWRGAEENKDNPLFDHSSHYLDIIIANFNQSIQKNEVTFVPSLIEIISDHMYHRKNFSHLKESFIELEESF